MVIGGAFATIEGIWSLFNNEPLFDYIAIKIPLWPRILLLLIFIAIAILGLVLIIKIFQRTRKTVQTSTQTTILDHERAKLKLVNETNALDWVTCDKCGFIGVRNIKTRELEEVEDNQRNTGQPILTRINSLGDTVPRHEKIPECIMQAEDFATLPPLSSQPLPLFYMQLARQCQHFIKWQKGLTPKEHKEIIDRQLRQQSTVHNKVAKTIQELRTFNAIGNKELDVATILYEMREKLAVGLYEFDVPIELRPVFAELRIRGILDLVKRRASSGPHPYDAMYWELDNLGKEVIQSLRG